MSSAPTPLFKNLRPAEPIPESALGPLQPAVRAIADMTQAPDAIAMQSVLALASLAVQPFCDVETLSGSSPTSLYALTVAASGERKSTCDKLASGSVAEIEKARFRQYRVDEKRFQKEEQDFRSRRRSKRWDDFDDVIECDKPTSKDDLPPEPPITPTIRIADTTIEGLVTHLERGNPSVGIFCDEGGQFFGGHSMKRENSLKSATGLSRFWDGSTIDRQRAGSPPVTLMGKRVSLHLMVQPDIANNVISDRLLRDQGLLSRVLIAWPESRIGGRLIDVSESNRIKMGHAKQAIAEFHERIKSLLESPFPHASENPLELEPRVLPLSESAKALLIDFYNRVESAQADGEAFEYLRGFASKAPEMAARIAAIQVIFQDSDATEVDEIAMSRAIEMMDWYLGEAARVTETGQTSEQLQQAEAIRLWVTHRWSEPYINRRLLVNRGPNGLRDSEVVSRAFAILEKNGWLIKGTGPRVINGATSHQWWQVVTE